MKIGDVVCWKWRGFERCGVVYNLFNERAVDVLWYNKLGQVESGLIYARSLLKIGHIDDEIPNKFPPLPNNENTP